MAVIHISEEEAARDLTAVLSQMSPGVDVCIDRGDATIAILTLPKPSKTLSEAIRSAEERNSGVLLDDQWSKDLEAVIRQHENDFLINPWE